VKCKTQMPLSRFPPFEGGRGSFLSNIITIIWLPAYWI